MKQYNKSVLILLLLAALVGCKKDWLDAKPDKSLVVPHTLKDLRALLDNNSIMNSTTLNGIQQFAEIGTDNYFIQDNTYASLTDFSDKRAYVFSSKIFDGNVSTWSWPYKRIFYTNVVLDAITNIDPLPSDQMEYDQIKGSALFMRAHAYFWLAQLFAGVYDSASADVTPGIPLRHNSDLNEPTIRASLKATYQQIVSDLNNCAELLPLTTQPKTRPSRAAAWGLLARVFLSMSDYQKAYECANRALVLADKLLDFNSINASPTYPIPQFNVEVLFSDVNSTGMFNPARCRVDTSLYSSYSSNDLRKTVFFKPRSGTRFYSFNGSYNGTVQLFAGVATDEIYLTRAECYARMNKPAEAMKDLNDLLRSRWKKNPDGSTTYIDQTASTSREALELVLIERRKELCFRGIRWMDLRRLNKDPLFQKSVTRLIDNKTYTLSPNSPLYIYPIPDPVIQLTGMIQNNR